MGKRSITAGMGHGRGAWPVLFLMLATVMVPTACVLWFMNQAMRNERLAVRQKLVDTYRRQLDALPPVLQAHWESVGQRLGDVAPDAPAGVRFAEAVGGGLSDSAVVFGADGAALYPSAPPLGSEAEVEESPDWLQAERLEYEEGDWRSAAERYGRIAASTDDIDVAARALRAQARCLARADLVAEGIEILTITLMDDRYRSARDPHGRLIAADGMLYALELMPEQGSPQREAVEQTLVQWVNNYGEPVMPSRQRRFLMDQLRSLGVTEAFPTREAEALAGEYVETTDRDAHASVLFLEMLGSLGTDERGALAVRLRPTHLAGVWSLSSPDRTLVALFRHERIRSVSAALIEERFSPADARIEVHPPAAPSPNGEPLLTVAAGDVLPGWQVALYLEGSSPLTGAADRQIALYLWSGITAIVVIAALTLMVAGLVARQMRLTRLKNDLIATVSHELKTPLASMRALVDTLLEERCRDDQQKRDYLELIGKENARLSHLIDNFLSFSRMERNKRAFELVEVSPADVARAAIDSVKERFEASGCVFETQIADDLPRVIGDRDALVTMLLNLLDNAHKYSEDEKQIRLRVFAADAGVCFEVRDNGAGMSRRVMKRIFDRFYQADQRLSRQAGGCGLGLSITRFIVDAHGGRIDVVSRPGEGSTFTVRLPAAGKVGAA